MEHTIKQYKVLVFMLLGVALTVHQFALEWLLPWIRAGTSLTPSAATGVAFLISLTGVYSAIVAIPLWSYEHLFWKVLNRRICFDSEWRYEVEYPQPSAAGLSEALFKELSEFSVSMNVSGYARMLQSPFSIELQEARDNYGGKPGPTDATWRSIAIGFPAKDNLQIHWELTRGHRTYSGMDDLTIIHRRALGLPDTMEGPCFIIPKPPTFVLCGRITYYRVNKRPKLPRPGNSNGT
jgi:hypothetical protein